MESVKLYVGYDPRESVGLHVFLQSVLDQSSLPVEIVALTPRVCEPLIGASGGTNSFTKARFLVPYLCGYKGHAIFADGSDMLMRGDIAELWHLKSHWRALQRVAHDYTTKHPRKYLGTPLEAPNEDYPRKNQSSVMVWNCAHYANRILTPEFVRARTGAELHRFAWLTEDRWLGELSGAWNHLVGECEPNSAAKLAHYTLGIPGFTHYEHAEFAGEWRSALGKTTAGLLQ